MSLLSSNRYAKIVASSVGLMSKFPILAPPKASDSQSVSTIRVVGRPSLSFLLFLNLAFSGLSERL